MRKRQVSRKKAGNDEEDIILLTDIQELLIKSLELLQALVDHDIDTSIILRTGFTLLEHSNPAKTRSLKPLLFDLMVMSMRGCEVESITKIVRMVYLGEDSAKDMALMVGIIVDKEVGGNMPVAIVREVAS